jgi:hypothetical protein
MIADTIRENSFGAGDEIRTRDFLLGNYNLALFSVDFEAILLPCACPCFSFGNLFLAITFKTISAKLVPKYYY